MSTITHTIGFKDIRKGDKIRLTQTSKHDGAEIVTTGVAYNLEGSGYTSHVWSTTYGTMVARSYLSLDWEESLELMERPEPKEYVIIRINADDSFGDIETGLLTKTEAVEQCKRTDRRAVKLVGLDD